MDPAITRFAPSPTGLMHVGGLRSALFNYLWAKHTGGKFLLRIEDTDQARQVEGAEEQIKRSLEWLGLDWDGEVVRQSDRRAQHLTAALDLVQAGNAYVADESPDQLAEIRTQAQVATQPSYDGRSRDRGLEYDPADPHQVIRFKWDEDPALTVNFRNEIAGGRDVTVSRTEAPTMFEDFVLIKADGFPTYNFAHVVDDHAMGVTDVIRGDEFIASAHKYVALHQALGWKPPRYAFLPPILGPDGQKKLSKRDGAKDALAYREEGFLPEALANFIALIGWSPGGDREFFGSLEELAGAFSLERVQKSPGRFDEAKLRWLNGEHLKQLDPAEVLQRATVGGFWDPSDDATYDTAVIRLAGERAQTLGDLTAAREGFYYQRPVLTAADLAGEQPAADVVTWLEVTNRELGKLDDWSEEQLQNVLTDLREELGLVPKQLFPVLRQALTGAPQTPALWDLMALFGKTETLARLEAAQSLVA